MLFFSGNLLSFLNFREERRKKQARGPGGSVAIDRAENVGSWTVMFHQKENVWSMAPAGRSTA